MKSKRKEVDLSIPEMIEGRIKNLENQAETLTNNFNQIKESLDNATAINTNLINVMLELIDDFENREIVIINFENNIKAEKIKLVKELLYNALIGTTPLFIVPILSIFLFLISPEIVAMMPLSEIIFGSGVITTFGLSIYSTKKYCDNVNYHKKIKYNNNLGNVQFSLKSYRKRLSELLKSNELNKEQTAKEKEKLYAFKNIVEQYKETMKPILDSHKKTEEETMKLERKI